jgi:hypothetical protein
MPFGMCKHAGSGYCPNYHGCNGCWDEDAFQAWLVEQEWKEGEDDRTITEMFETWMSKDDEPDYHDEDESIEVYRGEKVGRRRSNY